MHTRRDIVNKPWGHEVIWAHTASYVGKVLVIKPNQRLSRQYHEKKDESFYVLKGAMELEIGVPGADGFNTMIMGPGNCFHCPPGTVHRMRAGDEGCEVAEVSTPELDDIVRLDDDYDRT
jgi:mannose-6-phosphate isomerase-like protein (cupin superfamily)